MNGPIREAPRMVGTFPLGDFCVPRRRCCCGYLDSVDARL